MVTISNKKIWVAGHRGMVGRALMRQLEKLDCHLVTCARHDVDLTNQVAVRDWVAEEKPDLVIVAAAKVGGILANSSFPAEFLYQNLAIESNIIHSSYETGVEKLVFLGSSCIYPKFAEQPMKEEALLGGYLEPTNEAYAIAKIAGIKLCQFYREQYGCDFISAMPTNLYGPFDNYDLQNSHVVPALIRKVHEAKVNMKQSFEVWGTGSARREFLHVDDCASGVIFLLENYSGSLHINLGTGTDISIRDLAGLVREVVGYHGEIRFDTAKPDGTPRKLLDINRIKSMGWEPTIDLRSGLDSAYKYFQNQE